MVGSDDVVKAGDMVGDGGLLIGDIINKVTSFIFSMSLLEWLLIVFIVVGGFIAAYIIDKYNIDIQLFPKKPKKTIN